MSVSDLHHIYDAMKVLVALVYSPSTSTQKLNFLTEPASSMQVAVQHRKKDEHIIAHIDQFAPTLISNMSEVIYIQTGKVRVEIFDNESQKVAEVELTAGDILIQFSGGHGFYFLEDTELIEVKQGPYTSASRKLINHDTSQ